MDASFGDFHLAMQAIGLDTHPGLEDLWDAIIYYIGVPSKQEIEVLSDIIGWIGVDGLNNHLEKTLCI